MDACSIETLPRRREDLEELSLDELFVWIEYAEARLSGATTAALRGLWERALDWLRSHPAIVPAAPVAQPERGGQRGRVRPSRRFYAGYAPRELNLRLG